MLANNTSIHEFWTSLNRKYDLLNRKKCFWHHYIQEGMPEDDFVDFREDLAALGNLIKLLKTRSEGLLCIFAIYFRKLNTV